MSQIDPLSKKPFQPGDIIGYLSDRHRGRPEFEYVVVGYSHSYGDHGSFYIVVPRNLWCVGVDDNTREFDPGSSAVKVGSVLEAAA